jgi:Microcystin-dependent protein
MSTPYVGQISMFGGNFAPRGFAFCNGQTMAISQNTALFSLIGTIYGGDGQTTYKLPDMQSRLSVHFGQGLGLSNYDIGQVSGVTQVVLTSQQMPQHSHALNASKDAAATPTVGSSVGPATVNGPIAGNFWYDTQQTASPQLTIVPLANNVCSSNGGGLPHDNLMPSTCITFIIALEGIFPSRN